MYTADQQQRINIANAKVASAQKQRDSALADYRAKYSNFCDEGWWNYLTDCDVRNVTSKWRKKHIEALTVGIALFTNNYFNKRWTKPTTCAEALEKGIILSWECQRGKGDCIKSGTCNDKVAEYNAKLKALDDSATAEANAREVLENAQADLKALLNTIAGEIQNDPTFITEQNNILASIQKNRNAWIFGLLTVTVIVVGVVMWTKTSSAS